MTRLRYGDPHSSPWEMKTFIRKRLTKYQADNDWMMKPYHRQKRCIIYFRAQTSIPVPVSHAGKLNTLYHSAYPIPLVAGGRDGNDSLPAYLSSIHPSIHPSIRQQHLRGPTSTSTSQTCRGTKTHEVPGTRTNCPEALTVVILDLPRPRTGLFPSPCRPFTKPGRNRTQTPSSQVH